VLSRYQKRRSNKKQAAGLRDNTFTKLFHLGGGKSSPRKHAASEYHKKKEAPMLDNGSPFLAATSTDSERKQQVK
jgi:hypothetical protein